MNKKLKIFIKIVYYIFTFGLGVLLAFVLPGIIMTSNIPSHIEGYLNSGEYSRSVNLLINYDDKEIAYHKTFDDESGIVLFRTLVTEDVPSEEKINIPDKAYLAYSGFLYNTKENYKTSREINNKTKLLVNKDLPTENKISLLNYDTNSDGIYDEVLSKISGTYVYFDILQKDFSEIKSLTFYNALGEVYQEVEVNLDFTNAFFMDLASFIAEYNNEDRKDSKLQELENTFLAKSNNYEKCSYQQERNMAQKDGAIIVLIYFVCIYLIADFLVGQHFIIRFFIWLSLKIRGKEIKKEQETSSPDGVYGQDYYTMLTMKLVVPEDCDINFSVNYHNENYEIEMIFSKDNNYTITQRVHAGTYVNAWLEAPGYVSENLPTELEVRGYTMNVEVTLRKKKNKQKKQIKIN